MGEDPERLPERDCLRRALLKEATGCEPVVDILPDDARKEEDLLRAFEDEASAEGGGNALRLDRRDAVAVVAVVADGDMEDVGLVATASDSEGTRWRSELGLGLSPAPVKPGSAKPTRLLRRWPEPPALPKPPPMLGDLCCSCGVSGCCCCCSSSPSSLPTAD